MLDNLLTALVLAGALGLMVQGVWTLTTRRVPQPLIRLRGAAIARHPVRLGGFWLLLGSALLASHAVSPLGLPHGPGRAVFVVAGLAIVAAVAWYAWRRD